MKRVVLALLCLPATAALAQTAGTAGDGSVIQMAPLNALKPQATAPQPPPAAALVPDAAGGASPSQPAAAPNGQSTVDSILKQLPQGQDQTLTPGQPPGTLTTPGTGSGTGSATGQTAPVVVPGETTTTTTTEQVSDGTGGVVRWLDKVSGDTADLTIAKGQSATKGRLTVTLKDCRYPVGDPSGNAYAYLTIRDSSVPQPIFAGWMIASNPALDPLDSARYDVWLLHCTTK